MDAFFRLVAAGPMFFFSAWILMLFADAIGNDVGVKPFGYVTSMIATIAVWLVLAPAVAAIAKTSTKRR